LGLAIASILGACGPSTAPESGQLHAFYYPWYGTPELDGQYIHWRHDVMSSSPVSTFPGGKNIGADFFPEGGCYSSADPGVIRRHMEQLRQAKIGVICVSWLGPDSFEAKALPPVMDIAAQYEIAVNFHLEPAVQGSMEEVAQAIKYLIDEYGDHPAFYRSEQTQGRGLFYAYDSYKTPASEWARLLTPEGDLSIRGTRWDAAVVGLIVTENDTEFIEASGMNGGYAYFAVDGFSYASTTANWPLLAQWANNKGLLFIPSVGPGYADLRIRPWNTANQRPRQGGQYYDCMFAQALGIDPDIIGITSFNEWHEGTQIEPAMSFATDDYTYRDYQPLAPDAYLHKTADWVGTWDNFRQKNKSFDVPASTCCGGFQQAEVAHLAVNASLELSETFSEAYPSSGPLALIDGITGSSNFQDGCWQGFEGVDLVATIDLGREENVAQVFLGFHSDPTVWIFPPQSLAVEGIHTNQWEETL